MKGLTYCSLFFLAFFWTAWGFGQEPLCKGKEDDTLVKAAKKTKVSDLEAGMPDITLEKWVESLAENGDTICWEVNDCGEQDGLRRLEDCPLCAEVQVGTSRSDYFAIAIHNGTSKKGLSGKPCVWQSILVTDGKVKWYDTLAALKDALTKNMK